MLQHQAAGRRMSDRPPYGTQVDPADSSKLIPCPRELYAIEMIRHLLRKQKLSLRETARELNKRGIVRRGSSKWTHTFVKTLIDRAEKKVG